MPNSSLSISLGAVALPSMILAVRPAAAHRPEEFPFHYAAKILCGFAERAPGAVAPEQDYSTTINVQPPVIT